MSCRNYFLEVGIDDKNIITRKVPGSMELVFASNHMLINHDVDGIVTLGCIIKGETCNFHIIFIILEIDRSWFSKDEKVGVCGATSTPMWLMEEVKEKILEF